MLFMNHEHISKHFPSIGWQQIGKPSMNRTELVLSLLPKLLRTLCTYQLLQIPSADLHVSLVLVQALGEWSSITLTALWSPVVWLSTVSWSSHAVVLSWLRSSSRSRRSATEEAADCMSDRGANSYTTIILYISLASLSRGLLRVDSRSSASHLTEQAWALRLLWLRWRCCRRSWCGDGGCGSGLLRCWSLGGDSWSWRGTAATRSGLTSHDVMCREDFG